MKCWRNGRAAVRRVRLGRMTQTVTAEEGYVRPRRSGSSDMPTMAAELIIVEVAAEAGEAVQGTVPRDQPGAVA